MFQEIESFERQFFVSFSVWEKTVICRLDTAMIRSMVSPVDASLISNTYEVDTSATAIAAQNMRARKRVQEIEAEMKRRAKHGG